MDHICPIYDSIAYGKTTVVALLWHWSYCNRALSHWYQTSWSHSNKMHAIRLFYTIVPTIRARRPKAAISVQVRSKSNISNIHLKDWRSCIGIDQYIPCSRGSGNTMVLRPTRPKSLTLTLFRCLSNKYNRPSNVCIRKQFLCQVKSVLVSGDYINIIMQYT